MGDEASAARAPAAGGRAGGRTGGDHEPDRIRIGFVIVAVLPPDRASRGASSSRCDAARAHASRSLSTCAARAACAAPTCTRCGVAPRAGDDRSSALTDRTTAHLLLLARPPQAGVPAGGRAAITSPTGSDRVRDRRLSSRRTALRAARAAPLSAAVQLLSRSRTRCSARASREPPLSPHTGRSDRSHALNRSARRARAARAPAAGGRAGGRTGGDHEPDRIGSGS